jgi:hypothetical protein
MTAIVGAGPVTAGQLRALLELLPEDTLLQVTMHDRNHASAHWGGMPVIGMTVLQDRAEPPTVVLHVDRF